MIKTFPIELVDIDGINEENLLYDDKDVPTVIERFKRAGIDALFLPHCNFGSENRVVRVAKALGVPVLLWGPRDDMPNEATGMRSRDTQCGLFATGKMLRRHNVKFTYLTIRHPEDNNKELLWHCGNFPYSMAKDQKKAYARDYWIAPSEKFGSCMWQIQSGDVTAAAST